MLPRKLCPPHDLEQKGAIVIATANKISSVELDHLDGRLVVPISPTTEVDDQGNLFWKMKFHELDTLLKSTEDELKGYVALTVNDLQPISRLYYSHICTNESGEVTLACGEKINLIEGKWRCLFPGCSHDFNLGLAGELMEIENAVVLLRADAVDSQRKFTRAERTLRSVTESKFPGNGRNGAELSRFPWDHLTLTSSYVRNHR